ncbi:hypothetical protein [Magnetospirillum sp. SS-4]|uniref:hypothetical protein n=1 Tax=Magnetospirillum sp. SS-4 TaxID=2681465 RepID=UPI00137F11DB|nr:hypothetical protein [Magnetospirillum sp. SS-4]CAA7626802.1 conserved hypothetical protein [Magnetospirillum sp. SS-4]
MLTADPEEITRSAHRMLVSYGAHAIDIARERVREAGRPHDIREQDIAFLVLSEVERLVRRQGAGPS